MKALSYQIQLLEPVLATQLGAGEENSSQSCPFIPGSMLRGALVNLFLQKQKVGDPAQDLVCRRLFFDGSTCYLNAYPIDRNGRRALPKPLSWHVEKEDLDRDSGTIFDFANRAIDGLKTLPGDFCWIYGNEAILFKTGSNLMMHNASEERMVRLKDRSTVYRYEAIAAGQVFGAVILSENDNDLDLLRMMIDGAEIHIGGSRSAGYGRIVFKETRINGKWCEYEPSGEPDKDYIILTILSDLIIRDNSGHFTTDLDEIIGCRHVRAYQAVKIVGGFNRKWGLPLIQVPALQAGSVFVYPAGGIGRDKLQKYITHGFGERRAEGFGRIAINWHTQETLKKVEFAGWPSSSSIEPLSEKSKELANRIAARRLKNLLDQKLLGAVDGLSITGAPENAQLNRLRDVVRQAMYEGQTAILLNHIQNIKKAREQFERARVGSERFSTWLREGVEKEEIWNTWLAVQPPRIGGATAEITTGIKLEFTMKLLDALLKKTIRERAEGDAS